MFDTMMIGKKIKQARIDQNMTQMNLADAMGVSYQAVSNWERGNSMPDISKLADLCAALHISVNELLGIESPTVVLPLLMATKKFVIFNNSSALYQVSSCNSESAPIKK